MESAEVAKAPAPGDAAPRVTGRPVAELLTNGSIEMSPRDAGEIAQAAGMLPANMAVYVNSLPGNMLHATLRALEALREAGLDPVPHVAARRLESRAMCRDFIAGAVRAGVHRVLLIGGDQPIPRGPYASAAELLREGVLSGEGIREIGVAGYPEGHPRITQSTLDTALEEKLGLAEAQGLGAYAVTQFSFAPLRIAEYCAVLARRYPSLSVYIGMAGPTSTASLLRYAQRCGVSASLRALSGMGISAARLVTHSDPSEQLAALAHYCEGRTSCNVVGAHLFSFGGFARTAGWINSRITAASDANA